MKKYSWSILCLLLAGLLVLGACAPAAAPAPAESDSASDSGSDAAAEESAAEEGEESGEADGGGDLKFIAVQHAECAWDSFHLIWTRPLHSSSRRLQLDQMASC